MTARSRRPFPSPDLSPRALVEKFPVPRDLEAYRFEVEEDDYVVFVFPTRGLELPSGLTAAEQEVARAVLEGRSNAQIAKERGTSPRTIANQLHSISKKLGVSGRSELVQYCLGESRATSTPPASPAARRSRSGDRRRKAPANRTSRPERSD